MAEGVSDIESLSTVSIVRCIAIESEVSQRRLSALHASHRFIILSDLKDKKDETRAGSGVAELQ